MTHWLVMALNQFYLQTTFTIHPEAFPDLLFSRVVAVFGGGLPPRQVQTFDSASSRFSVSGCILSSCPQPLAVTREVVKSETSGWRLQVLRPAVTGGDYQPLTPSSQVSEEKKEKEKEKVKGNQGKEKERRKHGWKEGRRGRGRVFDEIVFDTLKLAL